MSSFTKMVVKFDINNISSNDFEDIILRNIKIDYPEGISFTHKWFVCVDESNTFTTMTPFNEAVFSDGIEELMRTFHMFFDATVSFTCRKIK